MSTYVIGDVQGCFDQLLALLEKIKFCDEDKLWFTGDLVNRGQKSLQTLRFIKNLHQASQATLVLGNHELGMLAVLRGAVPFNAEQHTFTDVSEATDKEDLLQWLEQQPLLHYDAVLDYALVHAGIYPSWDLITALQYATEVEKILRSAEKLSFYPQMFGHTPTRWNENLSKMERLRFIVNSFTRMRFCSEPGDLDLKVKESALHPPAGFMPWFQIPHRKTKNLKIVFGHWAALKGECDAPHTYALDTGCVWGNCLTAFRLEDKQRFTVDCHL